MIRNLFAASALTVTSLAVGAGSALAQSVDVPFSANVGNVCTFDSITAGVLVVPNNDPTVLTISGGRQGAVQLTCNGSAEIDVSDINPVNTAATTLMGSPISQRYVRVYDGGRIRANNTDGNTVNTNSLVTSSGSPVELNVQMYIKSSNNIPAGGYLFNTTITATPQ